ncbi:MAG: NAD(+) diphosphatase [Thermoanaerobaculia bacterium]
MRFDRLHGKRADAEWIRDASRRGWFLLMRGGDFLVRATAARPLLWPADAAEAAVRPENVRFLGGSEETPVFAAILDDDAVAELTTLQAARLAGWRELVGEMQIPDADLAAYALSLERWHQRTLFCGRCGSPTHTEESGHSRICSIEECAERVFPRTDPVVIAVVSRGDSCLLGRHQRARSHAFFTTLAGFVEPGESAEDAVRREVLEEAGVEVGAVRYFASQPWPFPHSLMLGFHAETADEEIRIDPEELAEARWFTRDEIRSGDVLIPPPFTIARRLIDAWVEEK